MLVVRGRLENRQAIVREKLVRTGKKFIQNVHSAAIHYTYWSNIGFWTNGVDADLAEHMGYYALPFATDIINIADNQNFDAIIGMDVLQKFDLRFERTGDFEIRLE